jgi:hypothetical protein
MSLIASFYLFCDYFNLCSPGVKSIDDNRLSRKPKPIEHALLRQPKATPLPILCTWGRVIQAGKNNYPNVFWQGIPVGLCNGIIP